MKNRSYLTIENIGILAFVLQGESLPQITKRLGDTTRLCVGSRLRSITNAIRQMEANDRGASFKTLTHVSGKPRDIVLNYGIWKAALDRYAPQIIAALVIPPEEIDDEVYEERQQALNRKAAPAKLVESLRSEVLASNSAFTWRGV